MYPDQVQANRRKALIAVVVLALLGLAVFAVVSGIQARGKVAITFVTAPEQVTIKLNGAQVGKNARVLPGTYELVVERDGFKSYSQQITISTDEGSKEFPVALTPLSDAAHQTAEKEQKLYADIEAAGGKRAEQEGVDFVTNNPIVRYIPFKTGYYAIDYGKDASQNLVIQITASSPLGRKVAIEKIRDWGFDPTDLRIEYLGFTNNLAGDARRNGAIQ